MKKVSTKFWIMFSVIAAFAIASIMSPMKVEAKVTIKGNPSGKAIAQRAMTYYYTMGKGQKDDRKRIKYSQPKRFQKGYGDCSTFVNKVYTDMGITGLGSYTAPIITNNGGKFIKNLKDVKHGDLVFFKDSDGKSGHLVNIPTGRKRVSHVGIYVGGGKFVDLAKSKGTISVRTFGEKNIKGNFLGAKRFAKRI